MRLVRLARFTAVPVAITLVLLAVATGAAAGGGGLCGITTIYDVAGVAYVEEYGIVTDAPGAFLFLLWIYVESNGEPGLQRGGESLFGDVATCQESKNPDLLVF